MDGAQHIRGSFLSVSPHFFPAHVSRRHSFRIIPFLFSNSSNLSPLCTRPSACFRHIRRPISESPRTSPMNTQVRWTFPVILKGIYVFFCFFFHTTIGWNTVKPYRNVIIRVEEGLTRSLTYLCEIPGDIFCLCRTYFREKLWRLSPPPSKQKKNYKYTHVMLPCITVVNMNVNCSDRVWCDVFIRTYL